MNKLNKLGSKDNNIYNKMTKWEKLKSYIEMSICDECKDTKQFEEIYKVMLDLEKEDSTKTIRGKRSNIITYLTKCKNCGGYFYKTYNYENGDRLVLNLENNEAIGVCNKCLKEE